MKTVALQLITLAGDELGSLPLPDLAVAGPEENGAAQRPQLDQEMADLEARLLSAIAAEGLELALDPLDLRIAVGRAVLSDEAGEEIRIPVRVREVTPEGGPRDEVDRSDGDGGPLLDGLFDLNLNDGGSEEVPDA